MKSDNTSLISEDTRKHRRFKYNEAYAFERLASEHDNPPSVLNSVHHLKTDALSRYSKQKTEERRVMIASRESGEGSVRRVKDSFAPSAIKIFPHIGMIDNQKTYTTTKNVEARDIKEAPLGQDKDHGYYHIRQNELKAYKNSFIQTKEMLLARKFKLLKK
jgi:hypothetical protein